MEQGDLVFVNSDYPCVFRYMGGAIPQFQFAEGIVRSGQIPYGLITSAKQIDSIMQRPTELLSNIRFAYYSGAFTPVLLRLLDKLKNLDILIVECREQRSIHKDFVHYLKNLSHFSINTYIESEYMLVRKCNMDVKNSNGSVYGTCVEWKLNSGIDGTISEELLHRAYAGAFDEDHFEILKECTKLRELRITSWTHRAAIELIKCLPELRSIDVGIKNCCYDDDSYCNILSMASTPFLKELRDITYRNYRTDSRLGLKDILSLGVMSNYIRISVYGDLYESDERDFVAYPENIKSLYVSYYNEILNPSWLEQIVKKCPHIYRLGVCNVASEIDLSELLNNTKITEFEVSNSKVIASHVIKKDNMRIVIMDCSVSYGVLCAVDGSGNSLVMWNVKLTNDAFNLRKKISYAELRIVRSELSNDDCIQLADYLADVYASVMDLSFCFIDIDLLRNLVDNMKYGELRAASIIIKDYMIGDNINIHSITRSKMNVMIETAILEISNSVDIGLDIETCYMYPSVVSNYYGREFNDSPVPIEPYVVERSQFHNGMSIGRFVSMFYIEKIKHANGQSQLPIKTRVRINDGEEYIEYKVPTAKEQ